LRFFLNDAVEGYFPAHKSKKPLLEIYVWNGEEFVED